MSHKISIIVAVALGASLITATAFAKPSFFPPRNAANPGGLTLQQQAAAMKKVGGQLQDYSKHIGAVPKPAGQLELYRRAKVSFGTVGNAVRANHPVAERTQAKRAPMPTPAKQNSRLRSGRSSLRNLLLMLRPDRPAAPTTRSK